MELEKAIEQLEELKDVLWGNLTDASISFKKTGIAIEIILKELEKKDKIIDLMAECIDTELSSVGLSRVLGKKIRH